MQKHTIYKTIVLALTIIWYSCTIPPLAEAEQRDTYHVASLIKKHKDGYLVSLRFKSKGPQYDRLNSKYSKRTKFRDWILPADMEDYKVIEELCDFSLNNKILLLSGHKAKPVVVTGDRYYVNNYIATGHGPGIYLKKAYLFIKNTPELEDFDPFFAKTFDESDMNLITSHANNAIKRYYNDGDEPNRDLLVKVHSLIINSLSMVSSYNSPNMFGAEVLTAYNEEVYRFGGVNSNIYLVNAYGESLVNRAQFTFSAVINDKLEIIDQLMLKNYKTSHLTADRPLRVFVNDVRFMTNDSSRVLMFIMDNKNYRESFLLTVDQGKYSKVLLDYWDEGD